MIICPVCEFRNPDLNVRCLKCQALLKDNDEEYRASEKRADSLREPQAEIAIRGALERLVRRLPLRDLWSVQKGIPHRFPFLAGFLSFFPGMGQFYNRQFGKGVLFLLCWWVAAALCIGCIRNPFSNWMLLGLLFCYLFIWNDAIVTAVRTNGQEWSVRQSVALWFALMFYAGIVTTAAQFLLPTLVLVALVLWMNIVFALTHGDPHAMSRRHRIILLVGAIAVTSVFVLARQTNSARIFTFVRVNKDVSGDLIRKGDVVFVNNIAYWFSPPRVGDVIHFDPPRFSAEAGANVLGINIMDYFQRVCGVPGDRIEKRAGVFYRNGSPVPPGLEPVHGEVIPEWTFEVPRGHYFAPVTVIPPDLVTSAIGGALGAPRPPVMFTPGWNFPKWKESTMVPEKQVFGRAVAILNPPNHRAHLPRIGN